MRKSPRLRTVDKSEPPYPLNEFPKDFGILIGEELVYLLATKGRPTLEGEEWERIFAHAIGADWKPSNVGLDDVQLGNTAWGAKTVKGKPSKMKLVRLISGRNSPIYSYGDSDYKKMNIDELGEQILEIWNERVSSVREKFKNLRTVVLIKSDDLTSVAIFEFDTIRYDPQLYFWKWNKRGNLEGYDLRNETHLFTWQPHGSQFTIKEKVPENFTLIEIKPPDPVNKKELLSLINFTPSWVRVTRK